LIDLLRSHTPRSIAAFTVLYLIVVLPKIILSDSAMLQSILVSLLLFGNAYLMNNLLHKHNLLSERTYLPAMFMVLFCLKDFSTIGLLHGISLSFCLIILEQVLNYQDNKLSDRKLFDSGFIGGLAFLLNPFSSSIILFPILGMLYFDRIKLRKLFVFLTAFAVPILLLLEINYLFDAQWMVTYWKSFGWSGMNGQVDALQSLVAIAIVFVLGFPAFLKAMSKAKVSIRSGSRLVMLFSLIGLGMLLMTDHNIESAALFIAVPFSWYSTNYLIHFRRNWLANLSFILLFIFFLYRDLSEFWI